MNNIENNIQILIAVYGGHQLEILHTITFNYPINPTDNDLYIYKIFLII